MAYISSGLTGLGQLLGMSSQQNYNSYLTHIQGLAAIDSRNSLVAMTGNNVALQSLAAQAQVNTLQWQLEAMQNAYRPAPPSPLVSILDEIAEEREMIAKLGYEGFRRHRYG